MRAPHRRRFISAAGAALERAYQRLGSLQPSWSPLLGCTMDSSWLDAAALTTPSSGQLEALLANLGSQIGSDQRKIIAAAFTLRFGAAGSAFIGPFLVAGQVPNLERDDLALRFGPDALLARVGFRSLSYSALASQAGATPIDQLRAALCAQAEPVLTELSRWSKLKVSVLWGLVVSAWGSELMTIGHALGCPKRALETVVLLSRSDHPAFQHPPRFFVVNDGASERVCQVRGSCCLNYRIGSNDKCVSCPIRAGLR